MTRSRKRKQQKRERKENIDWTAAIRRARRERDRNTARIEAGETFRGHQETR